MARQLQRALLAFRTNTVSKQRQQEQRHPLPPDAQQQQQRQHCEQQWREETSHRPLYLEMSLLMRAAVGAAAGRAERLGYVLWLLLLLLKEEENPQRQQQTTQQRPQLIQRRMKPPSDRQQQQQNGMRWPQWQHREEEELSQQLQQEEERRWQQEIEQQEKGAQQRRPLQREGNRKIQEQQQQQRTKGVGDALQAKQKHCYQSRPLEQVDQRQQQQGKQNQQPQAEQQQQQQPGEQHQQAYTRETLKKATAEVCMLRRKGLRAAVAAVDDFAFSRVNMFIKELLKQRNLESTAETPIAALREVAAEHRSTLGARLEERFIMGTASAPAAAIPVVSVGKENEEKPSTAACHEFEAAADAAAAARGGREETRLLR